METDRPLVGVPRETFPGETGVALVPAAKTVIGGVIDELSKLPAKEVAGV